MNSSLEKLKHCGKRKVGINLVSKIPSLYHFRTMENSAFIANWLICMSILLLTVFNARWSNVSKLQRQIQAALLTSISSGPRLWVIKKHSGHYRKRIVFNQFRYKWKNRNLNSWEPMESKFPYTHCIKGTPQIQCSPFFPVRFGV